jgi:hypothetical protein
MKLLNEVQKVWARVHGMTTELNEYITGIEKYGVKQIKQLDQPPKPKRFVSQ